MPSAADGVLVTRPPEAARGTARRLTELGWRPVFSPVAGIERLAADLPPASGLQAILVTSANAIGSLPLGYRRLPLLAVGDATAASAREAGFAVVCSAAGDATDLAALAASACNRAGGPLLHPCAREAPDTLEDLLAASGFHVTRREVYASRPAARLPPAARDALAVGSLAAALFFSPATARRFVALFRKEMEDAAVKDITALAISPPVAEALAPLPWGRIRVASRPNQDELLAQLP